MQSLHSSDRVRDSNGHAAGLGRFQTRSEITALPRLLRLLALEGCVVTIAAIGCQTAIAAQLQEQGADYVLALKSNQPTLHRTVVAAFTDLPPASPDPWVPAEQDTAQTLDKAHGRVERWRYRGLSDPDLLERHLPPRHPAPAR